MKYYKISEENFDELCNVAKEMNDYPELLDLWERLNDVINDIEDGGDM